MKNDTSKEIDLDSFFNEDTIEPQVVGGAMGMQPIALDEPVEETIDEMTTFNIESVIEEWAFRCNNGYPIYGKMEDMIHLQNILDERSIPLPFNRITITEDEKVAAGDFEQIAVDLWNIAVQKLPLPKKYNAYKSLFEEMSAIVKRMSAKKSLEKFSGQRIPTSTIWVKNSGGKSQDEPKTDIISKDAVLKVSVKKGPSQLMSPEKKEAIATFKVVAAASNISKKAESDIIAILNRFAERTTTLGFNTTELSNADPKELTGNKINVKAKQVYDLAYQAHKEMEKKLNALFENNVDFERQFLFEAASGYIKFNNNEGTANYMLAISNDVKHVKLKRMFSSKDEAITSILGKIKVSPSMKSNSYKKEGKKVGYAFYSSLRIHLQDVMKTSSKITEMQIKLEQNKHALNEAWYTDLVGKVKTFILKIWNKLIAIAKWIEEKLNVLIDYATKSFDNLLEVAEVEPDVNDDVLSLTDFYT